MAAPIRENLVLVGFMGTGKSSIGRQVARSAQGLGDVLQGEFGGLAATGQAAHAVGHAEQPERRITDKAVFVFLPHPANISQGGGAKVNHRQAA